MLEFMVHRDDSDLQTSMIQRISSVKETRYLK